MASSIEYLNFILEQLTFLDDVTYRPMMGEFIIYYKGKIIGGIYDDRFLVKPVKSAIKMMSEKVMKWIKENNVELITYRELRR